MLRRVRSSASRIEGDVRNVVLTWLRQLFHRPTPTDSGPTPDDLARARARERQRMIDARLAALAEEARLQARRKGDSTRARTYPHR